MVCEKKTWIHKQPMSRLISEPFREYEQEMPKIGKMIAQNYDKLQYKWKNWEPDEFLIWLKYTEKGTFSKWVKFCFCQQRWFERNDACHDRYRIFKC